MSQLRRFLASKPLPSIIDGYVRDGLVLCFDGYQPPANGIWKDLSGGNNDMIQGSTTTYDGINHCLTQEEMAANRELDITRFNIK